VRGMARTHGGLMMPLTVGRNCVLSLVVLLIAMLFMYTAMLLSVHCDVPFFISFTAC
jgi:hypothetical protein